jgi:N-acetylglucosaminyldiphosphoundecaprenol N-acetyl-beta-D-mannosaminyltransferase
MQSEPNSVRLLGVKFSCCSLNDIFSGMEQGIKKGESGYISITNSESVYHAMRLSEHRQYVNNANYSCCDGIAAALAGRMLGLRIPRLHGPDLMLNCCKYGVGKGWRHYFYGGKNGVPQLLSKKLTEKFPGMKTAGLYSPPFRPLTPAEDEMVIDQINKVNPDILWVGLGLLKQEQWIAANQDKIDASWIIGVGAAFDFLSDTIKRAPKVFREMGLEWFYRLVFEPRMFVRNIYSLSIFLPTLKFFLRERIINTKKEN